MTGKRLMKGLYEVTVGGVTFSVYHDRKATFGYQWSAENETGVVPTLYSDTKAGLYRQLEEEMRHRGQR